MTTAQLKEEVGALAGILAEERTLNTALRIALAQYRDISTWNIELPNYVDVQKTLADIWRVRRELEQRKNIVSVIAEGLRILRIFLLLPR